MKFGSLFAGIGGIDLGLERAGMECIWQVENDDYCNRVLEKHWPEVQRFGDVRECTDLPPVDLIAGGFPCQPHSVAGKRKGAEDDRNLWPEYLRIIREVQPRYVLAENVPGIISTYIDTVLSDLEGEGYTCATFNLPALAFDAPHRRERIFIIAFMDDAQSGRRGLRETEDFGQDTRDVNPPSDTSAIQPPHVAESERTTSGRGSATGQSHGQRRENPKAKRKSLQPRERKAHPGNVESSGQDLADAEVESVGSRLRAQESGRERGRRFDNSNWWTVEPNVGRVAYGISNRVERLRGLGNAVVPQVAQWIGERILEFDE